MATDDVTDALAQAEALRDSPTLPPAMRWRINKLIATLERAARQLEGSML
jgi:hypothetical protein